MFASSARVIPTATMPEYAPFQPQHQSSPRPPKLGSLSAARKGNSHGEQCFIFEGPFHPPQAFQLVRSRRTQPILSIADTRSLSVCLCAWLDVRGSIKVSDLVHPLPECLEVLELSPQHALCCSRGNLHHQLPTCHSGGTHRLPWKVPMEIIVGI